MNLRNLGRVLALLLLAVAWPFAAGAVTIHTWVDEAGVRHYADAPPAAASDDSEAFEIQTSPAADAEADYYSIANQWERLRAEREADEAQRLERERLRRESALAEQARAQRAAPVDDSVRGVVPWGVVPYGGGFRPGLGPGFHPGYGHDGRRSHGRRPFPIDRDAYVREKRRSDFLPAPTPRWPRERYTPGRQ